MRISSNRWYAVVTGDVVGSSRLSVARRRQLHDAMTAAALAVVKAFAGDLAAPPGITGGDGWQMLATAPDRSLRAALYYRAHVRAAMQTHRLDTRMVIAIGTVDFVPGDRVAEGDGEAYRLSGRALRELGRSENAAFVFPGAAPQAALDVIVKLVDLVAGGWSDRQALAVTGALRGWTQVEIATKTWPEPISQQAVAQHLARAGWSTVEHALAHFETVVADETSKKACI